MAGSSNISGDESIIFADNASFDGTERGGKMTTNGQLWIGSSSSPHVQLGTLTAGPGVSITNGSGSITIGLSGSGVAIDSFIPDSGTSPVVPDASGQVTMSGSGSTTTVGGTNSLTFQLTGLTANNVLVGAGTTTITKVPPSATSGVPLISQGAASDPAFGTAVVAGGGTGRTSLTDHGVLVGAATAAITQLAVGTNGQVLIGSTGADPTFGTLTSSDGSITFTTGAGTLSLQVAGGTTVGKTITGNTGGALSPTAGNWNTLGTGSITIAGSGSTLTTQLTGLTNHALQVGAGTATLTQLGSGTTGQVLQTNTSADPTWSTATYPSTTTVSQILYSSATNTVSGLATANNGVLITSATGVPSLLAAGTTGQVLTATTGSPPSWGAAPVGTVNVQRVTATGAFTYTPTSGMKYVIVELVGGGGGSGGVAQVSSNIAVATGGGGGGYAKFLLTAAQVGASLAGVVGAGGTAGASGNNAGGAGAATTLATSSAWTVNGGAAGAGGAAATSTIANNVAGGTVTTGTGTVFMTATGGTGSNGTANSANVLISGSGGNSILGLGAPNLFENVSSNGSAGVAGTGYGAGASGAGAFGGTVGPFAGAAGTNGIAIFTEFI